MNINEDNKIIIEEVEDNDSIEEGITVEKNGKKIVKLNKKTIFILSFIIGFLITILIGCIIIFSNDDKVKIEKSKSPRLKYSNKFVKTIICLLLTIISNLTNNCFILE